MNNFKKYLLISFAFALLNAVLLLAIFVPSLNHSDTEQYISTINYFTGESGGELYLHRVLKPLPVFISVLLNPILDAKNALIFQNLIFYFLSVWLVFLLIFRLYKSEKQAFYGTVLFAAAYPMLAYGLAALTDLSGWFFYLASVLVSLKFLESPKVKTALLAGLVAGLGMLFKESLAAAPIFFAFLLFIATNLSLKEKIKYLFCFGSAFILPVLINSIVIYKAYSYSYLHWYWDVWHHGEGDFYAYSVLRILIEIARVLFIGWIFVVLGAVKEFYLKNKERAKILIALVFPSLSFFLWSFPHNRIIFIAFPLICLLGSFGILIKENKQKAAVPLELSFLFLYVAANYIILDALLKYGPCLQGAF